jgi:drug/metabolite transporter (DMT)-like permease
MAVVALIAVTAVWGVTFVQVKDAVELYPEPVFAALFGITLADDRLGLFGWAGCASIMGGILLAEPAAAATLRAAVVRRRTPLR